MSPANITLPAQFTVQPSRVHTVGVCLVEVYTRTLNVRARRKKRKGVQSVFLQETGIVFLSIFYGFAGNMDYRFLNGFLVVLLIQHCTSEGRVALYKYIFTIYVFFMILFQISMHLNACHYYLYSFHMNLKCVFISYEMICSMVHIIVIKHISTNTEHASEVIIGHQGQ